MSWSYALSFKILLIGDSGVGKSSLLLTFISNSNANAAVDDDHHLPVPPTIGYYLLSDMFDFAMYDLAQMWFHKLFLSKWKTYIYSSTKN